MPIARTPQLAALLSAMLLQTGTALAQPAPVVVDQPWSRATPPSARTAAVYATLTSATGDRLTGVSSPASRQAEVHEMRMDGTVMRMRELPDGLALPAGAPVTLMPGGLHIMLTDLVAPLKQGQTVHLRLTFAKAPPMDIDAPVAALGAGAPPGTKPAASGLKTP